MSNDKLTTTAKSITVKYVKKSTSDPISSGPLDSAQALINQIDSMKRKMLKLNLSKSEKTRLKRCIYDLTTTADAVLD